MTETTEIACFYRIYGNFIGTENKYPTEEAKLLQRKGKEQKT